MKIKLSEFIDQLKLRQQMMDSKYSHPSLYDSLYFVVEINGEVEELELGQIEYDQSMGCGCYIGSTIHFKIKP